MDLISAELLLWGRVGAAVVMMVVKALPGRVGGGLRGVAHGNDGGLHSRHRVHAALPRHFKPHGLELELVVVGHLHERTPAEHPFKACPEPESGGEENEELEKYLGSKHCSHSSRH